MALNRVLSKINGNTVDTSYIIIEAGKIISHPKSFAEGYDELIAEGYWLSYKAADGTCYFNKKENSDKLLK